MATLTCREGENQGFTGELFKKTTVTRPALAIARGLLDNACALERELVNGGPVGSPATLTCELGQVRKEAAAAGDACAGM